MGISVTVLHLALLVAIAAGLVLAVWLLARAILLQKNK